MRRWGALFVALFVLPVVTPCVFTRPAFARAGVHARHVQLRPAVLARAAMVVDLATGRTLYAKRVEPEGRHTRVEYFRRRRTEPLYWSMVRGCLQPQASRETDSAPAVPQS
jgi:hypothetical protein